MALTSKGQWGTKLHRHKTDQREIDLNSYSHPTSVCHARLVLLYASYLSLVLKASSIKTLTGERGLKNPIQRTTFHLQLSSGARVMVGVVFTKFVFFRHALWFGILGS